MSIQELLFAFKRRQLDRDERSECIVGLNINLIPIKL